MPLYSRRSFRSSFARFLRTNKRDDSPPGLSLQRMQVYRNLVRNNVRSSLESCYPILKAMLGRKKFEILISCLIEQHSFQTPIYRELPRELIHFLESKPNLPFSLPPWTLDLIWYEFLELDLFLEKEKKERGSLGIKIPHFLLHTHYPIHVLQQAPRSKLEEELCYYFFYRDRHDQVQVQRLHPYQAWVISCLQKRKMSCKTLLKKVEKKFSNQALEIKILVKIFWKEMKKKGCWN